MRGNKRRMGSALALAMGVAVMLPSAAFAQSDLSIDKTDSADPVTTGSQFTYSIALSNAGPEAANGVSIDDTLPTEVDFVSATPSQGSCSTQGSKKVNCSIGTIANGGNASVAIVVTAQRAGTVINTATVSATSPADPTPANNTDSEQTVIQDAPGGGGATCSGTQATIVGTAGPDTLTGTDKRDVIAGLDGDDTIVGLDGKDVICGGLGNDLLKGQTDADTVKGGGGNDRVRGADGDDSLFGNAGDDNLGGGPGDDTLRGGSGTDRCGGGPGRDIRKSCE